MRTILMALALALTALPAGAQTAEQRDWCYSATATDDQTIDGCTALIQSSQESAATHASAYDNRAFAYNNKGLYDQAIADENAAVTLNPNSANEYINRGNAYSDKGLYDLAIGDFTRSIALKPDTAGSYGNSGNAFAYNDRAVAYIGKGDYNLAIADATQAIALKPDYANAYTNRGNAYEKQGLRDQAISDYHAALRIDPNASRASEGLKRLGAST